MNGNNFIPDGPSAKAHMEGRWPELHRWIREGRSLSWAAQELGLSQGGFSKAFKILVKAGLPDPRPRHFTTRSVAYQISRDWDKIQERLNKGETLATIAVSYARSAGTFASQAHRVAWIENRPPLRKNSES